MPFRVIRRRNEVILNQVIEGPNNFGDGMSCHKDWLLDASNITSFLDFIRKRKKDDEDETKILLEVFPEEAEQLKVILNEQAKAALKGKAGPLQSDANLDKLKPFEDEDEDEE